jgi:chemotaxis protein methyltransferase CheR
MKVNNISSYADYTKLLEDKAGEMKALMDSLMINFTEFFRDNSTYDFFGSHILPTIIKNQGKKTIRIWSIGCSTGEEPYSLAMITKVVAEKTKLSLVATDIDRDAIVAAKLGEYEDRKIKNIKKQYMKFFELVDGRYRIKDDIKAMVQFMHHDIFSERRYGSFDIIFCRNLLIYLSRSAQIDVLKKIHYSLNKGGFLVLGKTETIPKGLKDKFILTNMEERVYMKS